MINVCNYRPLKQFFDLRGLNDRFSVLFKEVCFLKGGGGVPIAPSNIVSIDDNYTLQPSDFNNNSLINVDSATDVVLTIDDSINVPIGSSVTISRQGAGEVNLAVSGSAVLLSANSATNLTYQNSSSELFRLSTNQFFLWGDIGTPSGGFTGDGNSMVWTDGSGNLTSGADILSFDGTQTLRLVSDDGIIDIRSNSGSGHATLFTGSGNGGISTSNSVGDTTFAHDSFDGSTTINGTLEVNGTDYPDGFLYVSNGHAFIGDANGDLNGTTVDVSDILETIISNANNGWTHSGNVTLSSLAGTGTRAVVVDATGLLTAPVSDERLKKDIVPITESVDVLKLLKNVDAVFYNWKDEKKGKEKEIGFIAQSFEGVKGMTGTMNSTGDMYLNYERITTLLWAQNKLLLKRIEELEEKIK